MSSQRTTGRPLRRDQFEENIIHLRDNKYFDQGGRKEVHVKERAETAPMRTETTARNI